MDHSAFQGIVYRYLNGQLEDNEYEVLSKLLHDETYRGHFEKIKNEWEANPNGDEFLHENLLRLKYKFLQRSKPVRTIRPMWARIASVAAILVAGLFLGYLISNFGSESEKFVFETPRGEKSFVRLPDGSEVWLNANSRLVYNIHSSSERQAELKGEAFFKIVHNARKPFTVKTNECDIKVLGTTFNVMAYDEFKRKEITLFEGKVDVQLNDKHQILKPGESLVLKDNQIQIKTEYTEELSGWVDNKFSFHNIPFSELIKRLENWYDVDITLENISGGEVNFTGTFKNEETIWQVLEAIKVYTPLQYKKSDLRQISITVGK